ncbi:peptidase C69 [Carboxydocella sp. JDF658]|nr:peptidase C69 [Carboxydocella sp. JDF658]
MMLKRADWVAVLQKALARGGDFADIFFEEKETTIITCEDNRIERINTGIDCGAGIRVISGETTAYAYTNDLSQSGLEQAAQVAAKGVAGAQPGTYVFDLTTPSARVPAPVIKELPEQIPVENKVEAVLAANTAARQADERIRQVSVTYGDVKQKVVIASSEGQLVEDERRRLRFVINAIAAADGVIQTGYNAVGGVVGWEFLQEEQPAAVAQDAARRAVLMLGAKPAPAGRMPVVMAGEAGGTMVHEACGHGLEADLVQKQLSVYQGKLGQEVASPLVTVADDATLAGKYGFYRYDDEGTPAQPVTLIENGVLVDYLYDRHTAGKEGRKSNGHGRRESYHYKPIPRMANTYIAPGKEDPEDIIRDVKYGLLVKKMGGGQVNTTNGDFVFDVAEGYLIEDGEIRYPVRGATLTGNGPRALQQVQRVGKDWGFAIGTCGKDGQGVPVSDAQPTILLEELVVGGTATGEKKIRRL